MNMENSLLIEQIPVLEDNYVYLVHEPIQKKTAVIDPAVADPVLKRLQEKQWKLDFIFNTHHHGDHVGANVRLKEQTACTIIGAKKDRERIPGIDWEVSEGDRVSLGNAEAIVFEVFGHTNGHIAYWFSQQNALFCGDTIFSLGCGKLFEGTAQQMWQSLEKLRALPPQTQIYCAHEYTLENAAYALRIEPNNEALQKYVQQCQQLRSMDKPTIPSSMQIELACNPFLRPESAEIQRSLGIEQSKDLTAIFAETRRRKDAFDAGV